MAVFSVQDENMATERSRIAFLQATVSQKIGKISKDLESLKAVWNDEKSESCISSWTTALEEIKKLYSDAQKKTDETLIEIGKYTNIYNE